MIGVSGCFGSRAKQNPIDDIDEAAQAVADIEDTPQAPAADPEPNAATPALAMLVGQYARRVLLLTWAVVIMAIVMIMREVD